MTTKNILHNEKSIILQAVVILDTFNDEFSPITDDLPLALIPLMNRPLIEYTLEFLYLGGVEEVFLFCCSHSETIKTHLKKCKADRKIWSIAMKISMITSESCCSFGDCMRDIDAKGFIRGDFILIEPGVIANMKLLPLIERHKKFSEHDKGAAMTVVYQEVSTRESLKYPQESTVLGFNDNTNKIVYHRKAGYSENDDIEVPLEIFLENSCVNIRHDLRDSHVSVCAQTVLPLFADNFDFQTKDDFIKGLLMNEEIMESTLYCHVLQGNELGGSVNNWRMYQYLSHEIANFCMHPITAPIKSNSCLPNNVIVGCETNLPKNCTLENCVIGSNTSLSENIELKNSFIFANSKIGSKVQITNCVIGHDCNIEANSVLKDSIIGQGVILKSGTKIEGSLIKSCEPDSDFNKLSEKAYLMLQDQDSEDGSTDGDLCKVESGLISLVKETVDIDKEKELYEVEDLAESDDEGLSYTQSPLPDDTKLFFTEVVDSLTRGYEDKLDCKNLILEVNSSRYAYNIALDEVNFHVVRAILLMPLENQTGEPDIPLLRSTMSYFNPLFSNYIRNASAMTDCLKAFEEVATTENVNEKWVTFILKFLYDKEYVNEEAILKWHGGLDEKSKLFNYAKRFVIWLKEAEETSSEESSEEED